MNTQQPTWPKSEARGVMLAITLLTGSELMISAAMPVMLPDLAGPLAVSADEMSWAQTLYGAAFLVAIPLAMWLARRVGHGRCMTYAAGAFTLATLGLAVSPNFETFLVLRIVQGLAGGMFLVRSQITMYNIVPRQFLAYILLWFCIGAYSLRALGAWYGGWMDDTLSWRCALAGGALLSCMAWQFSVRYLQNLRTNDEGEPDSIDGRTLAVLSVGLICLQCVLSRGEIDDWFGSTSIVVLSGIALCGLIYGARRWCTYIAQTPHLDREHRPSLAAGAPLSFLMGVLMTGALAVLPSFLRNEGRHSATQVGWLLMIDAGSTTVFIVFCIKWCLHRYKDRNTLTVGALLLAGGMCALSLLLFSAYPDWIFIVPFLIRGGVIGLFVPALDYGTQSRIKSSAIPFSSTTHYLLRSLGQSVGTTLVARIVDVRMTLHSSRLGEHLSILDTSSQVYSHVAQSLFSGLGLAVGSASQATVRDMALALRQEALVLADADCLLVMGGIGLLFAIVAWLFFDRDVDPLHMFRLARLHKDKEVKLEMMLKTKS
jgi:DHA2 family multidrug resistance protein